jgi:hypothetical protein
MYGGFEQVGSIGSKLPRNDKQTTTAAGDIVLYSGNQMVIFYGSNSWAYTRLGHITDKDAEEMAELLSNGDVTITGITENGVYTPYKLKFGGTGQNYISSHPTDDGLYIHCGADYIEFVSNDNNGSQAVFNMYASFRNSYGSSDARLKNVLSKRAFDAEDIAKLSLINYTWKEGKDKAIHINTKT